MDIRVGVASISAIFGERERERETTGMALACSGAGLFTSASPSSSLNPLGCKSSVAIRRSCPLEAPRSSIRAKACHRFYRFEGSRRVSCHGSLHNPTVISVSAKPEPLKIMISGPPAAGKGTQCQFITEKYGLVHIAAGDLLRAEIDTGSENGMHAKEYMDKGKLVPNEIVALMVKNRLMQPDVQENGWLLDGYPRSLSQASAIEELGICPDLFIFIDVNEEALVERVVGRRIDPITGKSYHLKFFPPVNEEIAVRLIQRFDDTAEKVSLRLKTYHQNMHDVILVYRDILIKVDGNGSIGGVFAQIDKALSVALVEKKSKLHSEAKTSAS